MPVEVVEKWLQPNLGYERGDFVKSDKKTTIPK